MKTAIVHEWLITPGGSERVIEAIYELFPSPVFSLIKNPDFIKKSFFKDKEIHTSFLQSLPFASKKYQLYLPLFPFAVEQFDLSDFEIVFSSSHSVAKGVITSAEQIHICYCHTPVRYAWDLYHPYLKDHKLDNYRPKSLAARLMLHYIRLWDFSSANRVDYYIANSNFVAKRIKKIYNREARVIYPPVDVKKFELCTEKDDYYLTVSRLVPYKKTELIVKAFNLMPEKKLIVIGSGPEYKKIKAIAAKNIEILEHQNFEILKKYMQKARAFVFSAVEDFGIVNVEAQSCGTPVIAYGFGGALETVEENRTGIFFKEQTTESIINAIHEFEKKESLFNYSYISSNAQKFSTERFKSEFKEYVDTILSDS